MKKNIKFLPLTKKEAEQQCKEINNMLCAICYYGAGKGVKSKECPCDPEKLGYYTEVETYLIKRLNKVIQLSEKAQKELMKARPNELTLCNIRGVCRTLQNVRIHKVALFTTTMITIGSESHIFHKQMSCCAIFVNC